MSQIISASSALFDISSMGSIFFCSNYWWFLFEVGEKNQFLLLFWTTSITNKSERFRLTLLTPQPDMEFQVLNKFSLSLSQLFSQKIAMFFLLLKLKLNTKQLFKLLSDFLLAHFPYPLSLQDINHLIQFVNLICSFRKPDTFDTNQPHYLHKILQILNVTRFNDQNLQPPI